MIYVSPRLGKRDGNYPHPRWIKKGGKGGMASTFFGPSRENRGVSPPQSISPGKKAGLPDPVQSERKRGVTVLPSRNTAEQRHGAAFLPFAGRRKRSRPFGEPASQPNTCEKEWEVERGTYRGLHRFSLPSFRKESKEPLRLSHDGLGERVSGMNPYFGFRETLIIRRKQFKKEATPSRCCSH